MLLSVLNTALEEGLSRCEAFQDVLGGIVCRKALGEDVGVKTGGVQRAGCGLLEPKEVLICSVKQSEKNLL